MKHTKAAFAEICGIKTKDLSVYIGRGQVIVEDREIDTDNPINAKFIERKLSKYLKSSPLESIDQTDLKSMIEKAVTDGGNMTNLKKYKLIADIEKIKADTVLLTIKEQRIRSEVIPVKDVSGLFNVHTQSILNASNEFIDEMLINISEVARLSDAQLSKHRKKMIEGLNSAVDRTILMTKKSMGIITDNFSISRGVGERD